LFSKGRRNDCDYDSSENEDTLVLIIGDYGFDDDEVETSTSNPPKRISTTQKTTTMQSTTTTTDAEGNREEVTEIAPELPLRKVTIEEITADNFACEPLKAFKLECNTCWCAKNGKEPRDCTRIACNPKEYAPLP
jgi:hypothetical protein